jgi:hypothetical protein
MDFLFQGGHQNLEFIIHAENEHRIIIIIIIIIWYKAWLSNQPGIDPVKELDPGLHELTRVNPVQPKKILKKN